VAVDRIGRGMKTKTKIIVVINQKGGVGKSTVAFNLAHGALLKRKTARVLCIDLDSQGNLSQYLTGDLDIINDTSGGVGLFLEGVPIVPSKTTHSQIDVLHGHKELDRYDNNPAVEARGYGEEMRTALRGLGYDYVIIDTPPAVGFRHLVALSWADIAVIPMEPVMSAIAGFQNVLEAITNLILPFNPGLKWFGVMNRANMRVKSQLENDTWIKAEYGDRILGTLANRAAVSDAMEQEPARPVWECRSARKALRDEWRSFCIQVVGK